MTIIATHRGIQIRQSEVPDAPLEWTDEERDTRGISATIELAKAQIDLHLARCSEGGLG